MTSCLLSYTPKIISLSEKGFTLKGKHLLLRVFFQSTPLSRRKTKQSVPIFLKRNVNPCPAEPGYTLPLQTL